MFDGQVAIVTGGSRGLGLAIAQALAAEGAGVTVVARSMTVLQEAVQTIQAAGGRALALPADVTDSRAVTSLVQETVTHFGPVNLLVNNAGSLSAVGPVWEVEPEAWWHDVAVNLRGTFLCARAVLPGMIAQRQGRIINVVSSFGLRSGAGIDPSPYASAYSSSKAGSMVLTQHLAATVQAHGISVFAFNPGFVQTAMTDYMMQSEVGQRWFPEVGPLYAARTDGLPTRAVRFALGLASGQADVLSGRCLRVTDDVAALAQAAEDIQREDRYTLRVSM
jgi:NAD(P)-dependent dehydrogenase (short-subunit alcohol dehydrogenase family)